MSPFLPSPSAPFYPFCLPQCLHTEILGHIYGWEEGRGKDACHTGQGKQCGPPPQSLGTGSFALPSDPLLPPLPHPRKGKGLLASMLRASLQRESGHRKSDVTWEGAGGAIGDVQDHAPSKRAPSYRTGSWQAVF